MRVSNIKISMESWGIWITVTEDIHCMQVKVPLWTSSATSTIKPLQPDTKKRPHPAFLTTRVIS